VAQAPSNVKDAAGGKSFTFITIVIRNGMGTLLPAATTLLSSLARTLRQKATEIDTFDTFVVFVEYRLMPC
jgi:hypothetical protein